MILSTKLVSNPSNPSKNQTGQALLMTDPPPNSFNTLSNRKNFPFSTKLGKSGTYKSKYALKSLSSQNMVHLIKEQSQRPTPKLTSSTDQKRISDGLAIWVKPHRREKGNFCGYFPPDFNIPQLKATSTCSKPKNSFHVNNSSRPLQELLCYVLCTCETCPFHPSKLDNLTIFQLSSMFEACY